MKFRIVDLSGVFLISATLFEPTMAQDAQKDGAVPSAEISRAVETFARLVNVQTVQNYGLRNLDQLKSLKPGRSFNKYMIGLNDIRKYQAGGDVESMIKALPAVEVALVDASGTIQSAVEFEKSAGGWRATGFGLSPDLKAVADAQSALTEGALRDGRLVCIPALHITFLAVSTGTVLNVVLLKDNAELGFRKGATLSAAEAIAKLAPVANLYNGLPQ